MLPAVAEARGNEVLLLQIRFSCARTADPGIYFGVSPKVLCHRKPPTHYNTETEVIGLYEKHYVSSVMIRLSYSLKSITLSPSSKVPVTKTSNNDHNIKTGDRFEHIFRLAV